MNVITSCKHAATALVLLSAVTAGGCAQQAARTSATAPAPWVLATSTMRWNEYACDLIARNQVGQFAAFRALAYVNLAIDNAIVAARREAREPGGAAAAAAAATLTYLFPKDEQAITARLAAEVGALGNDGKQAEFVAAAQVGRAAAADVIAAARTDRSDLAWSGPLPSGSDKWVSLAQPARPPLQPRLGEMRTFFLTTGGDFRAPPPPGYDSPAFLANLREVRAVSDHRSNEQLRIAQYWEALSGSFVAGLWNQFAREAIVSHGRSEPEAARTLALMHMAGMDANIACHESKYRYWVPRPTQVDPQIRLAIALPNHPSYPSNHACISGAMGLVLDAEFPDAGGRYFAMAREAGESRIYGGIHYRVDVDAGLAMAEKVAARALQVGVPADRPFVPVGR